MSEIAILLAIGFAIGAAIDLVFIIRDLRRGR
jgi:hypothetical protein